MAGLGYQRNQGPRVEVLCFGVLNVGTVNAPAPLRSGGKASQIHGAALGFYALACDPREHRARFPKSGTLASAETTLKAHEMN